MRQGSLVGASGSSIIFGSFKELSQAFAAYKPFEPVQARTAMLGARVSLPLRLPIWLIIHQETINVRHKFGIENHIPARMQKGHLISPK